MRTHAHTYTHARTFRQRVPGLMYSVHQMVIEYLLGASTLSALPEMSHGKAQPDSSTRAQLYNQEGTSALPTHLSLRSKLCAFLFLSLHNLLLEIPIFGHSSNLVQLPSLYIDTDTPSSHVSHLGGKVQSEKDLNSLKAPSCNP